MEKDIGKIKKNETTDIIIRIDDYKGKKGLTIREFVTSEKYTGFSKSGTRIPADEFLNFREIINTIKLDDLTGSGDSEKTDSKETETSRKNEGDEDKKKEDSEEKSKEEDKKEDDEDF